MADKIMTVNYKGQALDAQKIAWEMIQGKPNAELFLEAMAELSNKVDTTNPNNNYYLQGKRAAFCELLRLAEAGKEKEKTR